MKLLSRIGGVLTSAQLVLPKNSLRCQGYSVTQLAGVVCADIAVLAVYTISALFDPAVTQEKCVKLPMTIDMR